MITARSPAPFAVVEASQVGEARRQILALAVAAGLGAAEQGKLALVINELGTNLIKHGGGGQMIARAPEGPVQSSYAGEFFQSLSQPLGGFSFGFRRILVG